MKLKDERTILAIEPTKRALAYVVFENGELFDWGRLHKTAGRDELALLDRLLGHYGADVLVMEDPRANGCRVRPRIAKLLGDLHTHASLRRVKLRSIARERARLAWRAIGAKTNIAIAAAIADAYPVLQRLMPKPRKTYSSEDERSRIFGAMSLLLFSVKSIPRQLVS